MKVVKWAVTRARKTVKKDAVCILQIPYGHDLCVNVFALSTNVFSCFFLLSFRVQAQAVTLTVAQAFKVALDLWEIAQEGLSVITLHSKKRKLYIIYMPELGLCSPHCALFVSDCQKSIGPIC